MIVTLVLLYQQLGLSFLAGVVLAVAVLPINKCICNYIAKYSTKMMSAKDKRIKLMSEILDGIKVIKMHGWEALFGEKVEAIRAQEVHYLKLRKYLDAFCVYFWATTPVSTVCCSINLSGYNSLFLQSPGSHITVNVHDLCARWQYINSSKSFYKLGII